MTRLSLWTTALFSSVASFSSSAFEVDTRESQEPELDDQFRVIAIPFYDPSVDTGISVVPIYNFYADGESKNASTLSATLTYTQNDSYYIKGNAELLLQGDSIRFSGEMGFSSTNITLVDLVDTNHQEYTFDGDFYFKVYDSIYLGMGLDYSTARYLADTPRDKLLLKLTGFSEEYQADTGAKFSFLWDEREHYYYPYHGFLFELTYEDHGEWLGNDKDAAYSSLFSDYRLFYSLTHDDNHIIASRWVTRYLLDAENAPSSAYSTYGRQGRNVQRGFVAGDHIASHMTNLEMEYRYSISGSSINFLNNVAVVGLTGVGKVFGERLNPTDPYHSFDDGDLLTMVGLGLRYRLMRQERINVRMDFTYNNENEVLAYFSLGENI